MAFPVSSRVRELTPNGVCTGEKPSGFSSKSFPERGISPGPAASKSSREPLASTAEDDLIVGGRARLAVADCDRMSERALLLDSILGIAEVREV